MAATLRAEQLSPPPELSGREAKALCRRPRPGVGGEGRFPSETLPRGGSGGRGWGGGRSASADPRSPHCLAS